MVSDPLPGESGLRGQDCSADCVSQKRRELYGRSSDAYGSVGFSRTPTSPRTDGHVGEWNRPVVCDILG